MINFYLFIYFLNHLKHDHAGKNGERCKHDIVNWRYDSSVEGIQGLQRWHLIKIKHSPDSELEKL